MATARSTVMRRISAIRVPDSASGETVIRGLAGWAPGARIVAIRRGLLQGSCVPARIGWRRDGEVSDSPGFDDWLTVARPCWVFTSFLAPSRTPDATGAPAARQ